LIGQHPPLPRLTLNVGITGHRLNGIPEECLEPLGQKLDEVFRLLREGVGALEAGRSPWFDQAPAVLRLHTPLASGADQMAATSARGQDYEVRALLPFGSYEYAKDFAEGEEYAQFRLLLKDSDEVFCLPGSREQEQDAYLTVGKAVIAAADVIVAVWDGGEGNGPGGTAHIVDLALRAGVPVIHIPINREQQTVDAVRLLVGGDAVEPELADFCGPDDYVSLIENLLAPSSSTERQQLLEYLAEEEKTTNWRIEYPLLLSLLRVKKLPAKPWRQAPVSSDLTSTLAIAEHLPGGRDLDPRDLAYAWANFLAIRYAQLFRSGHVTNYFLSAFAVLVALFGLIIPSIKIFLVAIELATIGLLYLNTSAGRTGDWHRRWLQYRHLAESLRLLEYLKQTGLAGPPFRSESASHSIEGEVSADWSSWYCAAIWREMHCPVGFMSVERTKALAQSVIRDQISDQASYHRVNAHRMRHLDHRLHETGTFLMAAVIASCILYMFIFIVSREMLHALTYPFIFVTAGFPALGAAVFGMRGHGEHLLTASRSLITADKLEIELGRLEALDNPEELAKVLEQTTRVILADLNLWTVSYSEKSLEIPA
jgi:hypothetical protein